MVNREKQRFSGVSSRAASSPSKPRVVYRQSMLSTSVQIQSNPLNWIALGPDHDHLGRLSTYPCFITARCYASAVLAMALCLSVRPSLRPSQVGVLLKRLNLGLHKQHHTIAQGL